MTQQDIFVKWLSYSLLLVVLALVNFFLLPAVPSLPLPLLLPSLAVAVGALEGSRAGAGFGIVAGVVLGCLAHRTPLCIPALSLAGWLSGLTTQYVLRRDLVGHTICALAVLLVWEGSALLGHLMGQTAPLQQLLRVAGPELLASLVFTFPVYALAYFCYLHYGRIYHE